MSENEACLQDHELLVYLSGSAQNPAWDTHLHACVRCRSRGERLKREIGDLKSALPDPDRTPTYVVFRPADPASADQKVPEAFGKYRVLGLAGVPGGQGIVYVAYHPELGRNVAVKVPRRPKGSPANAAAWESLARHLQEEARILAQLDHAGIAKVFDAGLSPPENGQPRLPYLVMEMVQGQTLRQYAKGRFLPHAEAAEIVAQVAEALAYAHAHDVTHMDVKPSNVMIQENGKVKVIDFGISRLDQFSDDDAAVSGTPQYMSPEQARGMNDLIGPASDQFSAGAVLYELLEGNPPNAAETFAKSLEKAAKWNFDAESLRRSGAPWRLIAVCLKAMGKQPQDRYGDCGQLAAALRKAVRPVRWRLPTAIAVVVVLALLGLATGLAKFAHRSTALPKPPGIAQFWVKVIPNPRSKDEHNIDQSLPVMVKTGDNRAPRCYVVCDVPAGTKAALFKYCTATGKTEPMTIRTRTSSPDAATDHITSDEYRFEGPDCTLFMFVCGSEREQPSLAQVDATVKAALAGPGAPSLPPSHFVAMNDDQVQFDRAKEHDRDLVPVCEASPDYEIKTKFEALRCKLREQFAFVAGVAFCQQQEQEEP